VLSEVSTNVNIFNFTKLGHLDEYIFVKFFKMSLGLLQVEKGVPVLVVLVEGGLVHILKHHGLTFGRPVMLTRTSVAMTTGSHLVVERTVNFVLFRSINSGQWDGHFLILKVIYLTLKFPG